MDSVYCDVWVGQWGTSGRVMKCRTTENGCILLECVMVVALYHREFCCLLALLWERVVGWLLWTGGGWEDDGDEKRKKAQRGLM